MEDAFFIKFNFSDEFYRKFCQVGITILLPLFNKIKIGVATCCMKSKDIALWQVKELTIPDGSSVSIML
jgi:hypothetical protein